MINLKNLRSLFIDDEPTANPDSNSTPSVIESSDVPDGPPKPPPELTGEVDKRSYEKLIKAIENSNLDGFDYLEFKNSLKALDSAPLDEITKFKTAYAMATGFGVTKEKLLSSAKYYGNVLAKEKDQFRLQLKAHVEKEILSREAEKQKLAKIIQQKAEQIKKLQDSIQQHQTSLNKIQSGIDGISSKIEKTKLDFLTTYDYVLNQLKEDIKAINEYI